MWLHAIRLDSGDPPAALRVTSLGGGRPGTAVVIAGLTFFDGDADPLVALPRRQFLVGGAGSEPPAVDLGLPVRWQPVPGPAAGDAAEPLPGWGRPATDPSTSAILDLVAARDARLVFGDWVVSLDQRASTPAAPSSSPSPISIRELARPSVRVAVRVTSAGRPVPVRVRFVAEDGRYLPPLGHRDEVNPGIFEDTGRGPDPGRRHLRLRRRRVRDRPAAWLGRGRGHQGLRAHARGGPRSRSGRRRPSWPSSSSG